MSHLVASEMGQATDEVEDFGEDENIVWLPYSLNTCLELYLAWTRHGVMAVQGGWLNQPLDWLKVIRAMEYRHSLAWRRFKGVSAEEDHWNRLADGNEPGDLIG